MNERKKEPFIRFVGFTGDWEKRKAADIAEYSKGNGYSKNDLVEVGTPIILYGRLYTKYQFAINEVDTFTVPQSGSVYSQGNEVIVPASGETAEDIARASAVEKPGILLGGDLNILRPFDFVNPPFLALVISSGKTQKELAKKAQGKSVVHIHNSDIQEVMIFYPARTEQDRIVTIFRILDTLITLHQRKCDLLEQTKKTYLQRLFPRDGENVPEMRFAGFEGVWKERKLKNCFTERSERSENGELISVTINSGIIKACELDRIDNSSSDKSNYKVVKEGDIAYNSMRMWQGASGYCPYNGILSPAYTVVVPKDQMHSKFFSYNFKRQELIWKFRVNSQGLTSDTWNLKFPAFSNIKVKVPSYEEQLQISNFLSSLDICIIHHQKKLATFKTIKQTLLNQMFI